MGYAVKQSSFLYLEDHGAEAQRVKGPALSLWLRGGQPGLSHHRRLPAWLTGILRAFPRQLELSLPHALSFACSSVLFFSFFLSLFFLDGKTDHLAKNIFLRDHLRFLAIWIAKYRNRERRKMWDWGKSQHSTSPERLGNASGTSPSPPPQTVTQPFKLAGPWEAAWGWPRPTLANLRNPLKSCPLKTNRLPPPPSLGVFEFLSLLPKPDFLFLRKKLLKYPLKRKKSLLKAA